MTSKIRSAKTVWIGAAAAIIIVLILIVFFITMAAPDRQDSIVLPPETVDSLGDQPSQEDNLASEAHKFIAVTNENVGTVLQTLNRPAAYHQTYSVTVGSGNRQHQKEVEIWVNSGLLHAEVTYGQQIQSLVTDGQIAYLWYHDSNRYVSLELEEITPDDLLGLPDFDAYLNISQEDVVDSDYLHLESPDVQCIYVSTQNEHGQVGRYWVNLENGLLYQADSLENDNQIYSIRQVQFALLAVEDESFRDRFVLPDGTLPFTVTAKTPQP